MRRVPSPKILLFFLSVGVSFGSALAASKKKNKDNEKALSWDSLWSDSWEREPYVPEPPPPPIRRTVGALPPKVSLVLLHGSGSSPHDRLFGRLADGLDRAGLDAKLVLPFWTKGSYSGERDRLDAIIQGEDLPVILVGHSMGGAETVRAARRNPNVRAQVLLAASLYDIESLQLTKPTLLFHGTFDRRTSAKRTLALAERFPELAEAVLYEGAGHGFGQKLRRELEQARVTPRPERKRYYDDDDYLEEPLPNLTPEQEAGLWDSDRIHADMTARIAAFIRKQIR